MKRLVKRRLSALVLVAAGGFVPGIAARVHAWDRSSAPHESWSFVSIRATYSYTEGMREGTRQSDGQRVGVPYSDHAVGGEFEVELYDGRRPGEQDYPTLLGVGLGLRLLARVGAVVASDWEQPPGVTTAPAPSGWLGPVRFSLGAGTLAQIVRTTDFLLAAHMSLEFHGARATWSEEVAFTVFPGLRMIWQPNPLRLQLGYDFLPFWIGQGRLEHRASAAAAVQLGSIGLGARFTVTIGQERRPEGGLDDLTLGGALELVL